MPEQKPRMSEEEFYQLFDKISVGVSIQRQRDGVYIHVNQTFAEMLGYTAEDCIGQTPNRLNLWVDADTRQAVRRTIEREGCLSETEIQFRRRDGEIGTGILTVEAVEMGGDPCYLSTLQDVTKKVAVEQELIDSQQRFQMLAENLPGVVYLCHDDEHYTPIYLNEAIEEILGYPKELFLTRQVTFDELYHPEDAQFIVDRVNRAIARDEQFHLFYRMRHRNGEWLWIEEIGRGVMQAGHFYLEGFLQDVTDRREAQMRLARQAAEMTVLYELSLMLNKEQTLSTLTEIIVERAAALLNGEMSTLALRNPRSGRLVYTAAYNLPGDFELSATAGGILHFVNDTGQPLRLDDYGSWEHRIRRPPWENIGRILAMPLLYGTEIIGVLTVFDYETGVFTDEQEQLFGLFAAYAAVAIQNAHFFANEQRRREIAETLREVGRSVNSTLELETVLEHILVEADKVISYSAAHVMLRETEEHVKMVAARYSAQGEHPLLHQLVPLAKIPLTNKVMTEQHSLLVTDTHKSPLFKGTYSASESVRCVIMLPLISQNKCIGVLTIRHDRPDVYTEDDLEIGEQFSQQVVMAIVNARLLAQTRQYNVALQEQVAERTKELAKAKDEAERANEAKSSFLANMSHELRSPLTAILGFTQLVMQNSTLTAEEQEYLRIIHYNGQHLLTLINDVLDMSKIEAGKIELEQAPFDLTHLLNILEGMFQLKAREKGLELRLAYEGEMPRYLFGDKRKLSQILINLMSNAIKFTETGYVQLALTAQRSAESADVQLTFTVADSGLGIAPESLTVLFDPFIQLPQNTLDPGTGLGLAISQRFVQLMGGEITVESTPGHGSTFSFTIVLPESAAPETAGRRSLPAVIGLAPDQPVYRVLIVERLLENRLLLKALLAPIGFETKLAATAAEAAQICRAWHPHVMLINGRILGQMELLSDDFQVSSAGPKPVIMAIVPNGVTQEQLHYGVVAIDAVVQWPFQEEEIFEKLRYHLGVQFVRTQLAEQKEAAVQYAVTPATADVTVLPAAWLEAMHEAAVMSDQQKMRQLITQIEPTFPQAAAYMTHLVTTFATRKLIEITSSALGRIQR